MPPAGSDNYSIALTDITIFTSLVVFLFVSYNNMSYKILEKQYFSSQIIVGRVTSLAMHTKAVVQTPRNRWNLQRYILSAQVNPRDAFPDVFHCS